MKDKNNPIEKIENAIHDTRNPLGVILANIGVLRLGLEMSELDAQEFTICVENIAGATKNVAKALNIIVEEVKVLDGQKL